MFSKDLLKGKTVLITGGGTGLGRSMSFGFASLGAKIAIVSRKEENLKETVEDLRKEGHVAEYAVCDVRDPAQIASAVDALWSKLGPVNVLVNNAAGNFISRTEDLSTRAFDTIIGIVLHGSVYFSLELGKRWISSGSGGVILSIVTTYSWTGSAYVVPSAVSKAGVLALTRSLAVEWGNRGIRTVAIAPGMFPTEGAWKRLVPDNAFEDIMKSRTPLGRFGRHEELSDLAAFLISDGASYINGEVVTIDGGEWLAGAGQFNNLREMPPEMWEYMKQKRNEK
ncbi:MAG: SDR family oxidoreductase [Candidatus Thermoplasmatota archaeon]|jgi:NAD(P)-dependent dehydrogenase (short-subunit alcohol dehydrogenase family)|nr:SDR family oxidoreductase [Candidatus Thermoplasmatota archaeon]MCL5785301.1 SDR family oxidoreductase [Candidatus Thermoplasmatota archaeon]